MIKKQWIPITLVGAATLALAITGSVPSARQAKAQTGGSDGDSRIAVGLSVAPVPLNTAGKNLALVGLGSYYVNVVADCNGCHNAGPPTQWARGYNPFFGQQPAQVNPATYLGGGYDFGPLIPGSAHIISRNLTPDASGLPEGGNTFEQFVQILRTGVDPDHLHPTCTGAPNASCIPPPFDGDLLQIMPWPAFKSFSDHDLRAIYEYLSTVPCIQGNYPGESSHRCG